MCLGVCVSNSSVDNCGGSCDRCQPPPGGTATCDGNQCGFNCGSMKKCGSKCIASNGCCSDNDCPAQNGMARQCDTSNNTCSSSGCAPGFRPCGSSCIPNNSCCSASDCGGACQTCSGPGGSCVAVKNADDTDSCPGTCDNSGTCKSKRGQACDTTPSKSCVDGSKCTDGYCCESDCKGQCMACDVKDHQGTCYPVPSGRPHGGRTQCTSDSSAPECGGSCNGKSDGTCEYKGGECGKASCVSGGSNNKLQPAGTCNAGTCNKKPEVTCEKSLVCSANACKMSCSKKEDCVSGYDCNSKGECVKPSQPTNETKTILCSSGTKQSGSIVSGGDIGYDVIMVGDVKTDAEVYGFASFQLDTNIPKGSIIDSAKLTVNQASIVGDPYHELGQMYVAVVDYTRLSTFSDWRSDNEKRKIIPSASTRDWEVDVKSVVEPRVKNGTSVVNFRFRFENLDANGKIVPVGYDHADDYATLTATGDKRPRLTVTYHAK